MSSYFSNVMPAMTTIQDELIKVKNNFNMALNGFQNVKTVQKTMLISLSFFLVLLSPGATVIGAATVFLTAHYFSEIQQKAIPLCNKVSNYIPSIFENLSSNQRSTLTALACAVTFVLIPLPLKCAIIAGVDVGTLIQQGKPIFSRHSGSSGTL